MTTKQKGKQNGTSQELAQTIDIATAQQMIQAAQQERRERFAKELDRLCKDYQFIIVAEPYFDNDGRTRARIVIKDAQ